MQPRVLWVRGFLCGLTIVLLEAGPRDLPEYQQADAVTGKIIEDTQNLPLKEINDRGPAEALTQCSVVALSLAQQHEQQGWELGASA